MSVLSHIVWQRLPNEAENVVTEALIFIFNRSDGAGRGMAKLLHSIVPDLPDLPDLEFTTHNPIEGGRPDMIGSDGDRTFALLENKFWAGLTEQQPHTYVHHRHVQAWAQAHRTVAKCHHEQTIVYDVDVRLRRLSVCDCSGAATYRQLDSCSIS